MNPLGIASNLLGAGFSASSSAANGPVSVGQNFGFTSSSPFAVGSGANASGAPTTGSNVALIAGLAVLAVIALAFVPKK